MSKIAGKQRQIMLRVLQNNVATKTLYPNISSFNDDTVDGIKKQFFSTTFLFLGE